MPLSAVELLWVDSECFNFYLIVVFQLLNLLNRCGDIGRDDYQKMSCAG